MCDIYYARCKKSGCGVEIDMHLADFATERNEIEVFCNRHIPDKDIRVFKMIGRKGRDPSFRNGDRIGVRSLTENARKNAEGNCPNTSLSMSITAIDKLGRARKLKNKK